MDRYRGPPVKPIKPKSDETSAPVSASELRRQNTKKYRPRYRYKKRPISEKCSADFPIEAYEAFYSNWNLVPPAPEKLCPNWDVHRSVPETFARLSPYTLRHLTRHEIVENMPTTPSPHDLALINILQNKLAEWEQAEEDLFLRRKGWYCESQHIEDKAWVSWVMTQNRDFGSAVWRWLRLDDWDTVQSPRMKGL